MCAASQELLSRCIVQSGGRERERDFCIEYDFTLLQTCWSAELAATFTYGACCSGPGSAEDRFEKSAPAAPAVVCRTWQQHETTGEHSEAELDAASARNTSAGNGSNGHSNGYGPVSLYEPHARSLSNETLSDEASELRERILQHPLPVLTVFACLSRCLPFKSYFQFSDTTIAMQ